MTETLEQALEQPAADEKEVLPPHLDPDNPANGDDSGFAITESMFYGEPDAAPAKPQPKAAKEEADTPVEEEPEAPKEEVKAQPRKTDGTWDKDRQAKDQEIANLRKQVEALTTKALAQDKLPAEAPAAKTLTDQQIADIQELGDDASYEQLISVVNEMARRDKARVSQLAELKAERDAEKADKANHANRSAYEELLAEADKRYGKEFHNAAVARMAELWEEQGFGPSRYPDAGHTRVALMGVYAELKSAKLESELAEAKKGKAKPAGPATDGLRRAAPAVDFSGGAMTLEEAAAQMKAEGRFG